MRLEWTKLLETMMGSLMQFSIFDIIDILLVAFVIYQLLILTKQTRASSVVKGLGALMFGSVIAGWLGLTTITWLINQVINYGTLSIVIIFQPELRRILEKLGRGFLHGKNLKEMEEERHLKVAEEIAAALIALSERQVGALVIIENRTGLAEIIATGTTLQANVSAALLEQLFEPNTPLHDGATILNGDKIISAGCFLPLSDNNSISRQLGTRHRAALGVSEISDCLAFTVSEETGVISLAREGKLTRYLAKEQIVELIHSLYQVENPKNGWFHKFIRRKEG